MARRFGFALLLGLLLPQVDAVVRGAFLLVPHAEAVSLKHIDRFQPTGVTEHRIGFFLGEDGGIWYTVIDRGGLSGTMTTGNSMNPFDQASDRTLPADCQSGIFTRCTGFINPIWLNQACLVTDDLCSGIYARIRGPGTFIDTVTTDVGNPLCHTQLNIIATGLDHNFWYTLFDLGGAVAAGFGGGQAGGVCPASDPFAAASEDKNASATTGGGTGFVFQPSLLDQCAILDRACVGAWVRFP